MQKRNILRTVGVAVALAVTAQLASAGEAGPCSALPVLRHTPPFIGNVMTLRLEYGPASQPLTLFGSRERGYAETPLGTFELDRDSVYVVATGMTDPDGNWSLEMTVPPETYTAEREMHFQALIGSPDVRGDILLSEGAHMRALGPRVYAGVRGTHNGADGVENGALSIVSSVHGALVAQVDYGHPLGTGQRALGDGAPVLCPVCALGAVMAAPDEMVVFDPFFGQNLNSVPFVEASTTIFLHPEGLFTYVLETGYRPIPEPDATATLHKIQLCGAVPVDQLDLPALSPGLWVTNEEGTLAYIAELTASGRTAVRIVDLVDLQDMGTVRVGTETSNAFLDMEYAYDSLYVTTTSPDDGSSAQGEMTRVVWAGALLSVSVSDTLQWVTDLEPAPYAHAMLGFEFQPYVPAGSLWMMRAGGLNLRQWMGLPWVYLPVDAMQVQDDGVWVVDASGNEPPGGTEPGRLYHLELPTGMWTQYDSVWPNGPVAMDLLRDAYVDQVVLIVDADPLLGSFPRLITIDKSVVPSVESALPLGTLPTTLHAAPVPAPQLR